mmetsp:Transcript_107965/g.209046  ORF Transcript_107965/g.209046 Transcript_107965/m.209046 type:complete len:234 (+) Transcript_107965:535-1236(+)
MVCECHGYWRGHPSRDTAMQVLYQPCSFLWSAHLHKRCRTIVALPLQDFVPHHIDIAGKTLKNLVISHVLRQPLDVHLGTGRITRRRRLTHLLNLLNLLNRCWCRDASPAQRGVAGNDAGCTQSAACVPSASASAPSALVLVGKLHDQRGVPPSAAVELSDHRMRLLNGRVLHEAIVAVRKQLVRDDIAVRFENLPERLVVDPIRQASHVEVADGHPTSNSCRLPFVPSNPTA